MLRLIGGGILCMCIAYIGLAIRRYYVSRKNFYEELLGFIDALVNNITFLKSPLPKVISSYTSLKKTDFCRLLNDFGSIISNGEFAGSGKKLKVNIIAAKEMGDINTFFGELGKYDSATQLNNLGSWRSKFDTAYKVSVKKADTYGALAFKLGVLLGILAMILVA